MKRKQSNTESARLMRRSTAYARLSQKASYAGNERESSRYQDTSLRLKEQSRRAKAREELRKVP